MGIAVLWWGTPAARTVIPWHGMTHPGRYMVTHPSNHSCSVSYPLDSGSSTTLPQSTSHRHFADKVSRARNRTPSWPLVPGWWLRSAPVLSLAGSLSSWGSMRNTVPLLSSRHKRGKLPSALYSKRAAASRTCRRNRADRHPRDSILPCSRPACMVLCIYHRIRSHRRPQAPIPPCTLP